MSRISEKLFHGLPACTFRKSTSFNKWIIYRTGGQPWNIITSIIVDLVNYERVRAEVGTGSIIYIYFDHILNLEYIVVKMQK